MRRFAPILLFAALAVALLSPSILGGKVLGGDDQLLVDIPFNEAPGASAIRPANPYLFDASYVFHPDQQFVRSQLRSGHLPAWSPYLSAGRPLLAAQQSAPLFPLNAPSYVLPYWRSLAFVAAIKLVVGALGLFLLAGALGLRRGPATFAGIAYGFSAFLVSWLSHPHDNVFVLLPWLLLTLDRAAGRGRAVDALGLGAVTGMCLLGGHLESLMVLAPVLVPWAAFRLWAGGRAEQARGLARRIATVGAGALLGAVVGAVMMLPLLEALSQSYDTSRGQAPLPRGALMSFAFPEFWGRADHGVAPGGPLNYAERTAYVGVLPVLLAAGGLVARRPRPSQLFFAGAIVLGCLIVFDFGSVTTWITGLPGLELADMNRFLVVIALALAVLGGYGLQAVLDGDRAARVRILAAAAVVGAIPALKWLLGRLSDFPHPKEAIRHYLPNMHGIYLGSPDSLQLATVVRWSGLAGLLLVAVLVVTLRPRLDRWLVPACIAIAALDLVLIGRSYQSSIPLAQAQPPTPASVKLMRRTVGHQRMAVEGGGFGPNVPSRYGLRDVRGHELPVVERHQKLFDVLGGGGFQRTAIGIGSPPTKRLLDVFAVRTVMAPNTIKSKDSSLRPFYRNRVLTLYANRGAFPRAWVAYGSRNASGQLDARTKVIASNTRALREAPVIEGSGPARPRPAERSTPAAVTSEDPRSLHLDVRARRAGWLVLDDTYYPGWKATVDGHGAAIKPANSAFRAIRVPAGRHRVTFEYRSTVLRTGWILSLAGTLFLIAGTAFVLVRERRRPASAWTP